MLLISNFQGKDSTTTNHTESIVEDKHLDTSNNSIVENGIESNSADKTEVSVNNSVSEKLTVTATVASVQDDQEELDFEAEEPEKAD